MNRLGLYVLLPFIIIFFSGCSGGGNPVASGNDDGMPAASPESPLSKGSNGVTGCIEYGQVVIDKASGDVKIITQRGAALSVNALAVMEPPAFKYLDIDKNTFYITWDNFAYMDVIITHPLKWPFFRAFDVRGIIFGHNLLNADGYTTLMNPDDFTGVPYGYQDGLLGTPDEIGQYDNPFDLWGYKYFCDGLGLYDDVAEFFADPDNLNQRGTFSPGMEIRRPYSLSWVGAPSDFFIFNYAILASFHGPSGEKPWDIEDFEISVCNAAEPFTCSLDILDNSLFYRAEEAKGGSVSFDLLVGDWQGFADYDVKVQLDDATGTTVHASSHEPTGLPHIERFKFGNITPVLNKAGKMTALVTATDRTTTFGQSWFQGLLPEDNPRYDDYVYTCWKKTIPVSNQILFNLVDITPDYFKPVDAEDLFVQDGVAYIAADRRGFITLDVSDPTNPTWLGRVDTPFQAEAIWVEGNYAYLTGGGIVIYDISNPSNPLQVGELLDILGKEDIAVQGDYAYLIRDSAPGGLSIVDVSDPQYPVLISFLSLKQVDSICVRGDYAFIAGLDFNIVDISVPTDPSIVSSLDIYGPDNKLDVTGDYGYVITGQRLYIIDISDLNTPVEKGNVCLDYRLWDIKVVPPYAYIVCNFHTGPTEFGLWVVDITDPDNPQVVHQCPVPSEADSIFVMGDVAYLSNRNSGLYCTDISNPLQPELIGSYLTPGSPWAIGFCNDTLVVANHTTGLFLVDVSVPDQPQMAGFLDVQDDLRWLATSPDFVYTRGYSGTLMVVNCANPASPEIWGTVDVEQQPHSIYPHNNYLYVPHYGLPNGIYLINISNPHAPNYIGNFNPGPVIERIHIDGDIGYAATNNQGLSVYDMSNPILPVQIGSYPYNNYLRYMMAVGDIVYISLSQDYAPPRMIILDASDPADPTLEGSFTAEGGSWVFDIKYDYAFVLSGGLFIADVSNPEAPTPVGVWDFGLSNDIIVRGNIAYLTGGGVRIIQLW